MYFWSPESIRFRIDAAEQTGYDDAIIAQLLPELSEIRLCATRGAGWGIRASRWRKSARE